VEGYATGGDTIIAVYGLEPLDQWTTNSDSYEPVAELRVQLAAGEASSPQAAQCDQPQGLSFSSLLSGSLMQASVQMHYIQNVSGLQADATCADFCSKTDVWGKHRQKCTDLDDESSCEESYMRWGTTNYPCAWDGYSCSKSSDQSERSTCSDGELVAACRSYPPAPEPPPLSPGDVVVPSGQTYILDQSVVIGKLFVQAGATLAFVDAGLTMSTTGIIVMGTLKVGTETCPLDLEAHITLRGERPVESADHHVSDKGIVVHAQGTLDIHGKPYAPTWTRLQRTAFAGATVLELQQPVDWEVGQELVVVTTVHIDEREEHQNEVRTITEVNGDRFVSLAEPLQFSHYGGSEYSGEVALLSRSITIQGDEQSETSEYGGHIMCMQTSTCRLSFTKAFRMGQKNVMGRYPFHFHLMGDVSGQSYFKGLSIHRSFFRALTIHATSNTTASRCVAYDVLGSAVYLEDGVEEDNLLEFNLVALVHPIKPYAKPWKEYDSEPDSTENDWIPSKADRIVPTDLTPAGFYCLNPRNRWVGNVASGGFTGFVFPAVQEALGLSSGMYSDLVPQENILLEFDGNTAHSSGQHYTNGACIYVGATLRMVEHSTKDYEYYYWKFGATSYVRGFMLFNNTKMFACRAGFKAWGFTDGMRPQIKMQNAEFHDNMLGIAFFGHNSIQRATFTAHTDNTNVFPCYAPAHAFQLYDTLFTTIFSDVTFRGYRGPADTSLYQFVISECCVPSGMLSVFQAKFPNTTWNNRLQFDPHWPADPSSTKHNLAPQSANLQDADGSITGVQGGAILGAGDLPACLDGSCESFEWWRLDDGQQCQLVFTELDSRGYWACPRADPLSPQRPRTVVTIFLARTDSMSCNAQAGYPFFPWTRGCLRDMTEIDMVKGTIYHFGNANRRQRTGWAVSNAAKQVVGTCCDIGWYLKADGGAPPLLVILLDAMVPTDGLIFATRYSLGAVIKVEKCFGLDDDMTCSDLTQVHTKSEFLSSPTGSSFLLESANDDGQTLFLKLTNERNEYFDDGEGHHALLFTNNFFVCRYIVRSTTSGPVNFVLPPGDWISSG